MMLGQPCCARCTTTSTTMTGCIDHTAFPHIIAAVLSFADAPALNAVRLTSHEHYAQVEAEYARRARHVVPHTLVYPLLPPRMSRAPPRPPRIVFQPLSGADLALPALTSSHIWEVQSRTDLPAIRGRMSAIRVLDLVHDIDLHHFRELRCLLDGVETVRLVGELRNPNHFPFAPRTVVVKADLSSPEPFRGWHYQTRELVVNYTASRRPQLLSLAFFPPSGCYGPRDLTLNFAQCDPLVLAALPNGARVGCRLLVDLARVICDGHRVTLVDWYRIAALFPPRASPYRLDDTVITWGGPLLERSKAARRRACFLRLAEMALLPDNPADPLPKHKAALEWADWDTGTDIVRSLTTPEYACLLGPQAYADMTANLWSVASAGSTWTK